MMYHAVQWREEGERINMMQLDSDIVTCSNVQCKVRKWKGSTTSWAWVRKANVHIPDHMNTNIAMFSSGTGATPTLGAGGYTDKSEEQEVRAPKHRL